MLLIWLVQLDKVFGSVTGFLCKNSLHQNNTLYNLQLAVDILVA